MSIKFNADEVLKMAVRAESNAAAYYKKAAEMHSGKAEVNFLLKMAEMEIKHEATFSAMMGQLEEALKDVTAFDPYMESLLYLNEMADSNGAEGSRQAIEALSAGESLSDIVKTAITMEKNAVVFYLGLKDMVPENLGKDKIQDIIDEERGHIVILADELKKLAS
jgi:rubrerythrin